MPSRRRYLTTLGSVGTAALAGCTTGGVYDEAADAAGDVTDWPTLGHDAANTGYNPDSRGPRVERPRAIEDGSFLAHRAAGRRRRAGVPLGGRHARVFLGGLR